MKYTTETRLYIKNNKDIVKYFDEVKEQYSYIMRKVYYIIRNNPKIKTKSKATKGKSKNGKEYNKMLHSLAYRIFLDRTEQICNKKNVGLIKVNPAWTSWIAKNKFCDKMKLNIHTGASFVIARRGMNIKDVV